MPVIHITVESSFTGTAGGFQRIAIDDNHAVKELIRQYCSSKGIEVNVSYAIISRSNLVFDGNKSISYYGVKDNESLLLGSITDESRSYRFGHWFTLAGLGFLFGLLGMTVCIILFAVIRTVPDNYAIVIDAGSTHSDVILYKWPGMKVNNTGEVEQVSTCYVTGGIAQVTPNSISNYFDTCFSSAEKQIPASSRTQAEVLLGATAGMRLLNSSDPVKAESRIESAKQYLKATDLVIKDSNVGIISGATEGMSGWITINFLKDTIYSEVGHLNSSWGALDLGGASTQITFEVSEDESNKTKVIPLNLFGHRFHVFSQSFLCYGVVQAMIRYRATLLQQQFQGVQTDENITIISPCEPSGNTVTLDKSDFDTPCLKSSKTFFSNLMSKNYKFVGSSDYDGCKLNVGGLLDSEVCKQAGWARCMDKSYIPKTASERKFVGFSSFAYVGKALKINENTTKLQYLDKTKRLCQMSHQGLRDLKASEGNNSSLRDLEALCFKAQLVYSLLSDVYEFNTETKWKNLKFTTKVNDTSLGWSLGYMINATEDIATGKSVPQLQPVPFALLLVLFAVFLFLSIGFVFHGMKLRKSASSYQRKITMHMDEELIKFMPVGTATQNTILRV